MNDFVFQRVRELTQKTFEHFAENPLKWHQAAENLKHAADVLRESGWPKERKPDDHKTADSDMILGPPYMLLVGLAIENVLKGIIVARHPEVIQKQKLSPELTSHGLRALSEKAGLKSRPVYDLLLEKLENFIKDSGRYPVAKTRHQMGERAGVVFSGDADFKKVDVFWKRLVKEFHEATEQVGLSGERP